MGLLVCNRISKNSILFSDKLSNVMCRVTGTWHTRTLKDVLSCGTQMVRPKLCNCLCLTISSRCLSLGLDIAILTKLFQWMKLIAIWALIKVQRAVKKKLTKCCDYYNLRM